MTIKLRLLFILILVLPSKNPQEFAQYVSEQMAYWGKLIIQSGIKSELN